LTLARLAPRIARDPANLLKENGMTAARALLAFIIAGVVRSASNFVFYGMLMGERLRAMMAAHPGMFREVVPALIIADFIFAALFVFFLAKVGRALGGGAAAGAKLGAMLALIGPALGNVYIFYTSTWVAGSVAVTEAIYFVVSGAIVGAIAGGIALKSASSAAAAA
jgi:hypothetical protein